MENQKTATLAQFFVLNREDCRGKMRATGPHELEKQLKEVHGVAWPLVMDQVVDRLPEMLDISVPGIVAKAWSESGELQKYRQPEKTSAAEPFLLPLREHTVKSEHHPHFDIIINGQPAGKIEFDVNLALSLEGLVLKIQEGKIKQMHFGKCSGVGEIGYKNVKILEQKSPEVLLPAVCEFGEGIAIKAIHETQKEK